VNLNLNTESIKSFAKMIGAILIKNKLIVSSVVILVSAGVVLLQISSSITPEIDTDYLEKESLSEEQITFEQDAIDQLKQLNDSRITIQSDFADRDNPFVNP
jgi:hypothetical protein